MTDSRTSTTLLQALRDPREEAAWRRFDRTYRPLLLSFTRRLGLQEHDAEDAAQRTILAFRHRYAEGAYDATKGRLRDWLLGIARFEIADICAERARQPMAASQRSSLAVLLSQVRDPESLTVLWDRQWCKHVLRRCFACARRRFSERDIHIFQSLTRDGREVACVARECALSEQAVRQIKYRILRHMRRLREDMGDCE